MLGMTAVMITLTRLGGLGHLMTGFRLCGRGAVSGTRQPCHQ